MQNGIHKLLVVDDHVLFREGLVGLLQKEPDFNVVGQTGTVAEAVKMTLELQPDMILMDVVLPDGDGIKASKEILSQLPNTKIVILTLHDSEDLLLSSVLAGAIGYLVKSVPFSHLLGALRGVIRGEAALSRASVNHILSELFRLAKAPNKRSNIYEESEELTHRESEILELLGDGASNREISKRLFISENTVKIHVSHILEKLHVKSRLEAGKFARRKSGEYVQLDINAARAAEQ